MIETRYRFTWRHLAPLLFFLALGTALAAFSPASHPAAGSQPTLAPTANSAANLQSAPSPASSPTETAPSGDETIARLGSPNVAPPVFTQKIAPTYPPQAIEAGIQGYVILEAVLKKSGEIDSVIVLKGIEEGRFGLEQAAIDALKQWQYQPGTVQGSPADVRMTLKIDFLLNNHYRVLDNLEWLVDGDEEEFVPPKALLKNTFDGKIRKGSFTVLPLWVSLDETGKLLETSLTDQARKNIGDEELVNRNLAESLKHILWVTAKRDGQAVPSEVTINIPISLDETLQD